MPSPNLFRRAIAPLALIVLAALVYLPGLSGGFLFDDYPNIVTNARIHAESFDPESLRRAASAYEPGLYGRPLATLGFALDWAIGGGEPHAFKVHSLLVHLFNALLVFALVGRLLDAAGVRGTWPRWAPLAIAAVWAIHPLQISTVLYVVQRMEMLAATFVLLALLAYLRGRERQRRGGGGWAWIAASFGLAGLGMLAKESAILFPAFALALEVTVLRFEAGPRDTRVLRLAYSVGVAMAAALYFFWIVPKFVGTDQYDIREFTLSERLMSQLRVLPMYLGQMVLPVSRGMPFYYDSYPISTGWLSPWTTLAGGVFLLVLGLLAAATRRRLPLLSLGLLWFFAAHLITSGVLPLELAFEHRNYFALLGVVLAIAATVSKLPLDEDRPIAPFAALVVVLGLASLGAVRAATWGNPLLLASDLVAKAPMSPRASNDLATIYIGASKSDPDSPFYALGAQEFERGSRLPGSSPLPEQGLILMAATAGIPANPEWWDRFERKLRERPVGPQEMSALSGLGTQRRKGLPIDDARLVQAYQALISREGVDLRIHLDLADLALGTLHDETLAERTFIASIAHPQMTPEIASRIVAVLAADGHAELSRRIAAELHARGLLRPTSGHAGGA